MFRTITLILFLLMGFFAKANDVGVGDKIPDFKLMNAQGNLVNIYSYIGNKPLVIYFYPKDDTPGCTMEANAFQESYGEFKKLDATVIGISSDSPDSHQKFSSSCGLEFELLSDIGGKARAQLSVPTSMFGLLPGRVTYVIDLKGIIVEMYDSQIGYSTHIQKSLDAIKQIER